MTMKRILCSSLAVVCVASAFVGCSAKKEKKDDSIGKWECEKIVMGGEEADSFLGIDAYALFQIELKDGNKGPFYSFLESEDGEVKDIEWKKKDGKIQLINKDIFDDEEVFLKKDGDKMILDMSGEDAEEDETFKATLAKVDSFKEIPEDMEMSFSFGNDDDSDFEFDDDDAEEAEDKE